MGQFHLPYSVSAVTDGRLHLAAEFRSYEWARNAARRLLDNVRTSLAVVQDREHRLVFVADQDGREWEGEVSQPGSITDTAFSLIGEGDR